MSRRSNVMKPRSSFRLTKGSVLVDRELDLLLRDELEEHGDAFLRLLHRALDGGHDVARLGDALAVAPEGLGHVGIVARDVRAAVLLRGRLHDGQLDGHGEIVEDRKSTRLNSSHVRISYAV